MLIKKFEVQPNFYLVQKISRTLKDIAFLTYRYTGIHGDVYSILDCNSICLFVCLLVWCLMVHQHKKAISAKNQ